MSDRTSRASRLEIRQLGATSFVFRPSREILARGGLILVFGLALVTQSIASGGPPVGRIVIGVGGAWLVEGGLSMVRSRLVVDAAGLQFTTRLGSRRIPWRRVVSVSLRRETFWQLSQDGAGPFSAEVVIQPGRVLKSYALRSRWEEVGSRKHQILTDMLERSRSPRHRSSV